MKTFLINILPLVYSLNKSWVDVSRICSELMKLYLKIANKMLNLANVIAFIKKHTSVPINFTLRTLKRIKPKIFWRLQT